MKELKEDKLEMIINVKEIEKYKSLNSAKKEEYIRLMDEINWSKKFNSDIINFDDNIRKDEILLKYLEDQSTFRIVGHDGIKKVKLVLCENENGGEYIIGVPSNIFFNLKRDILLNELGI
jgi:hypothetical protein